MNALLYRCAKVRNSAFTVVELMVVVAVIVILAGIVSVSYSAVTNRGGDVRITSDLSTAADMLELDYVKLKAYPQTSALVDGGKGFVKSDGTTLTYTPAADYQSYCLQASSSTTGTKKFYVTQDNPPREGTCATTAPAAPNSVSGFASCSPSDSTTFIEVSLQWAGLAASQVDTYRVYDSTSGSLVASVNNTATNSGTRSTSFVAGELMANSSYTLRYVVRAVNKGVQSNASNVWSYTVTPSICTGT